jgi:hypothetical protein
MFLSWSVDMIPTVVICLSFLSGLLMISPAQLQAVKLMEFGKYNCEDEMSKLDYLALQLPDNADTYGYIIVYGGRAVCGVTRFGCVLLVCEDT